MTKRVHVLMSKETYAAINVEANRDRYGINTTINNLLFEALMVRLAHPDRAGEEAPNINLVKPEPGRVGSGRTGRPRSSSSTRSGGRLTQEQINDLWSPGWRDGRE